MKLKKKKKILFLNSKNLSHNPREKYTTPSTLIIILFKIQIKSVVYTHFISIKKELITCLSFLCLWLNIAHLEFLPSEIEFSFWVNFLKRNITSFLPKAHRVLDYKHGCKVVNNCIFKFQTMLLILSSHTSICSPSEKPYVLIKILLYLMQGLRRKHNSKRKQYLNVLYCYEKENISVLYFFYH